MNKLKGLLKKSLKTEADTWYRHPTIESISWISACLLIYSQTQNTNQYKNNVETRAPTQLFKTQFIHILL